MEAKINKVRIRIVQGDLLQQEVDGLVHATVPSLTLDDELAKRAGPTLKRACTEIGWCDVGTAIITEAGRLPYAKVIHVVGPRWGEGSERGKLANATWDTLRLAEANKLKSIALPAISVGPMGYPVENAAKTILGEIIDFTFEPLKSLRTVIICLASELVYETFEFEFSRQIQALKDNGEGKVRA